MAGLAKPFQVFEHQRVAHRSVDVLKPAGDTLIDLRDGTNLAEFVTRHAINFKRVLQLLNANCRAVQRFELGGTAVRLIQQARIVERDRRLVGKSKQARRRRLVKKIRRRAVQREKPDDFLT